MMCCSPARRSGLKTCLAERESEPTALAGPRSFSRSTRLRLCRSAATCRPASPRSSVKNLDAVVLAAAGLKRLGVRHPRMIPLPTDRFVPAPAQGALAIQTRTDGPAREIVAVLDCATTHRAVIAERTVLRRINAGCHTPVGALATIAAGQITLHAKLFTDDYSRKAEGVERGSEPVAVGQDSGRSSSGGSEGQAMIVWVTRDEPAGRSAVHGPAGTRADRFARAGAGAADRDGSRGAPAGSRA